VGDVAGLLFDDSYVGGSLVGNIFKKERQDGIVCQLLLGMD
jgi:hypothetical protein